MSHFLESYQPCALENLSATSFQLATCTRQQGQLKCWYGFNTQLSTRSPRRWPSHSPACRSCTAGSTRAPTRQSRTEGAARSSPPEDPVQRMLVLVSHPNSVVRSLLRIMEINFTSY